MGNQAQSQFTVAGWEEQTWDGQPVREVSGARLTQAEVAYTYLGDVVGAGQTLSLEEMRELLQSLERCTSPRTCALYHRSV
jgi:hypothetical protein